MLKKVHLENLRKTWEQKSERNVREMKTVWETLREKSRDGKENKKENSGWKELINKALDTLIHLESGQQTQ